MLRVISGVNLARLFRKQLKPFGAREIAQKTCMRKRIHFGKKTYEKRRRKFDASVILKECETVYRKSSISRHF